MKSGSVREVKRLEHTCQDVTAQWQIKENNKKKLKLKCWCLMERNWC
jgi:hypothetical protein